MDKIQSVLIKAGHKELAQEYYLKIAQEKPINVKEISMKDPVRRKKLNTMRYDVYRPSLISGKTENTLSYVLEAVVWAYSEAKGLARSMKHYAIYDRKSKKIVDQNFKPEDLKPFP